MTKLNNVAIAIVAIALGSTSAFAQSEYDQIPQVAVKHGDLDLTNDQGRQALNRRTGGAVKRVCGDPQRSLKAAVAHSKCKKETWSSVNEKVELVLRRRGAAYAKAGTDAASASQR